MTAENTKTKAPISAAFAAEWKETFPELRMWYVREGELSRGQDNNIYADCFPEGTTKEELASRNEQRAHQR